MSAADEAVESLAGATMAEPVKNLVVSLLAQHGQASPAPAKSPADAGRVFVTSISVEGFRGIGPSATLPLEPRPGLTLVVGPNGCGKSTFAEAAERALTGTTVRWRGVAGDARANWRNVHHEHRARVAVSLRGSHDAVDSTIAVEWGVNEEFDVQRRTIEPVGAQAGVVERWLGGLESFPPLLPYAALDAVVSGTASALFDAFDSLLGLADLERAVKDAGVQESAATALLATEKGAREEAVGACRASGDADLVALAELIATRGSDANAIAERVVNLRGATSNREVDTYATLDLVDQRAVLAAAERLETVRAEVASLANAQASRAEGLADLLAVALRVHSTGESVPCPVCRQGTLDDAWRQGAVTQVDQLREEFGQLEFARMADRDAVAALEAELPSVARLRPIDGVPAAAELLARCGALANALRAGEGPSQLVDRFVEVATLVEACRSQANERRDDRARRAAPCAEAVARWSAEARAAAGAAEAKKTSTAAKKWLRGEIQRLRDVRLTAISEHTHSIWTRLRQTSTIELGPLELLSSGTQRKLGLRCLADGRPAMARSVLSQGELHALALALFLPRALHPDSSFGFVLIDDPVQALDQLKVDGLAEVLADVAKTHQVIVFTHDGRLPDAIDRLGLPATVLEVSRGAESTVAVTRGGDAVSRALDEAGALASDTKLTTELALVAIAASCQAAVEASALRAFRRHPRVKGLTPAELDAAIDTASTTWDTVSLGLHGEVRTSTAAGVESRSRKVIGTLRSSTHEQLTGWTPRDLVNETRRAIRELFGDGR